MTTQQKLQIARSISATAASKHSSYITVRNEEGKFFDYKLRVEQVIPELNCRVDVFNVINTNPASFENYEEQAIRWEVNAWSEFDELDFLSSIEELQLVDRRQA